MTNYSALLYIHFLSVKYNGCYLIWCQNFYTEIYSLSILKSTFFLVKVYSSPSLLSFSMKLLSLHSFSYKIWAFWNTNNFCKVGDLIVHLSIVHLSMNKPLSNELKKDKSKQTRNNWTITLSYCSFIVPYISKVWSWFYFHIEKIGIILWNNLHNIILQ